MESPLFRLELLTGHEPRNEGSLIVNDFRTRVEPTRPGLRRVMASPANLTSRSVPRARRAPTMSEMSPATPNGSAESSTTPAPAAPGRLLSLDAYRGLIMVTLAFNGFGLAKVAQNHLKDAPDSTFWKFIFHQFEHVEWAGCGYWDLIQPSFMFMVGLSMAYSYVRRQAEGQPYARLLGHAAWRSVVLVFLGIFLISNWGKSTTWSFMNVLTQMGLGYLFLFLCWGRAVRTQAVVVGALLAGTWLLYVTYPGAGIDPATGAAGVGVSQEWAAAHLANLPDAWHKNANIGHALDLWLLNLLPQAQPFTFSRGGYQTINFVPSLATMILGLMCGELLRGRRTPEQKFKTLCIAGIAGIIAGQLLEWLGVCPLVKRIWTPSWAIYSTGWCCLLLAGLFGVIDLKGRRRWAFPLVVVGMNSIAMYSMSMLLKPWVARTWQIHLGPDVFKFLGETWSPAVQATLVGLTFWLVCWWMHRRRIFLRI